MIVVLESGCGHTRGPRQQPHVENGLCGADIRPIELVQGRVIEKESEDRLGLETVGHVCVPRCNPLAHRRGRMWFLSEQRHHACIVMSRGSQTSSSERRVRARPGPGRGRWRAYKEGAEGDGSVPERG